MNFLITNRIPRRLATTLAGRVAQIESRWFTRAGIAVWEVFGGSLDLHEAERFDFITLEDVFTRRLKPGSRPIDASSDVLVSPCDAIVGAHGVVENDMAMQIKGAPYRLADLLLDPALVERHRGGWFVTLRLRSNMYHRFHAPCDAHVRTALWIAGDTWNVNPPALARIERLFCKNERVVIELEPRDPDYSVTLVAVAAVLVASVRLECLAEPPRRARGKVARHDCYAPVTKGDELGHFRNGSTIVVFTTPGFEPSECIVDGATIRVGQPLLRRATRVPSSQPATQRT